MQDTDVFMGFVGRKRRVPRSGRKRGRLATNHPISWKPCALHASFERTLRRARARERESARVVRTFLIYERAYFLGLLHMDIRPAMPAPRGCEDGNGRSACNFNGGAPRPFRVTGRFVPPGGPRIWKLAREHIRRIYIYIYAALKYKDWENKFPPKRSRERESREWQSWISRSVAARLHTEGEVNGGISYDWEGASRGSPGKDAPWHNLRFREKGGRPIFYGQFPADSVLQKF